MCAALSNDGLLLHKPLIGPYNTERLIYFLDDLHNRLVPAEERGASNSHTFIVVWDNVAFHHSAAVTDWFAAHPKMSVLYLPPYSPFLNPIEEFFSLRGGRRFMTTIHTLIATDSGADPPSSRQLRCTVRLCSVIRPEYAPPPDRALSVSRLITDTARILHPNALFFLSIFFYRCLLSQKSSSSE